MHDAQGAIRFGDWELRPRDSRNWELYRLRASERGFGDGTARWASEGRYYSHGTFANALGYAANCELKDGTAEAALDIHAALTEYQGIFKRLSADMDAALAGRSTNER